MQKEIAVFIIVQTVMRKTRYGLIASGSCVVLVAIVLIRIITSELGSSNQRSFGVSEDLNTLLEALAGST